jgi:hypothetical protein
MDVGAPPLGLRRRFPPTGEPCEVRKAENPGSRP